MSHLSCASEERGGGTTRMTSKTLVRINLARSAPIRSTNNRISLEGGGRSSTVSGKGNRATAAVLQRAIGDEAQLASAISLPDGNGIAAHLRPLTASDARGKPMPT